MQTYYDNRYWTMWKLPMFGCSDPSQVLREVKACTKAFPGSYIRLVAFDNISQCQTSSFLVHRPKAATDYTPPKVWLLASPVFHSSSHSAMVPCGTHYTLASLSAVRSTSLARTACVRLSASSTDAHQAPPRIPLLRTLPQPPTLSIRL